MINWLLAHPWTTLTLFMMIVLAALLLINHIREKWKYRPCRRNVCWFACKYKDDCSRDCWECDHLYNCNSCAMNKNRRWR